MLHRAVNKGFIEARHDGFLQAIAQPTQLFTFSRHFLLTKLTSFAQADDSRNVERTGTHAAFVAAAVNDGGKLDARILAANVEGADALGAIDLVTGDGHQVDAVFLHVDRNLSDGLHRIHVEENAFLLGDLSDFSDGLDDADFVVRVHDRDQDRLRRNCATEIVEINAPVSFDRQICHFVTILLETLTGIERGFVLGDLRDDVIALFAVHLGDAFDREIRRFSSAAGEDNLFRRRIDQLGDLPASVLHGFLGLPTEFMVAARCVAEFLREIRNHGFDNARVDRRGRVIIKINRKLNCHSLSPSPLKIH